MHDVGLANFVLLTPVSLHSQSDGILQPLQHDHAAAFTAHVAIGAGAVNQAVKALVLATGYLKEDGIFVTCVPEFADVTIDDKVRRILRTAARFGWLDREQLDPTIPRYNAQGREAALQTAREGMVLLKNDGLLPLTPGKLGTLESRLDAAE